MLKNRLVIIGGGFAGLWAGLSSASARQQLGANPSTEIILINKTPYHDIRFRNYQINLSPIRIPLNNILNSVDIKFIVGEVFDIHIQNKVIFLLVNHLAQQIYYDRLIVGSGSQLAIPHIYGLKNHYYNIDSYFSAIQLQNYLTHLRQSKKFFSIVVMGSGCSGLELVARLRSCFSSIKIYLLDHKEIANTLGASPHHLIIDILNKMHIELLPKMKIIQVTKQGILLGSNIFISSNMLILTTGLRANPLTRLFPNKKDVFDRISVDKFLRIPNIVDCFAAGDVASAKIDKIHTSTLSCQHARFQGMVAGYNAIADLNQLPLFEYHQAKYITCLDLGDWGGIYMKGWERTIIKTGPMANRIKNFLNNREIHFLMTSQPQELLNAAKLK